jgi:hypothetical protein
MEQRKNTVKPPQILARLLRSAYGSFLRFTVPSKMIGNDRNGSISLFATPLRNARSLRIPSVPEPD